MLNFYINRAGKNLSASRHAELEKAKTLLSEIIAKQKSKSLAKAAKTSPRRLPEKSQAKNLRQNNNSTSKSTTETIYRRIQPQLRFEEGLEINHVMSNSFGFGGNCSSIIFSKSQP